MDFCWKAPEDIFEDYARELRPLMDSEDFASRSFRWSLDHCKLLFLVSLYGRCAASVKDKEEWIREPALMVLIYENIVSGFLSGPDYAPASVLLSQDGRSRRIWMNISQEGKGFIDDLREMKFLNSLKL